MKKIAVTLFLSLLVGMMNASAMPVSLGETSHIVQSESYSHCEEAVTSVSQDDSQSTGKVSLGHYCCVSIAVLHNPVNFIFTKSTDFYLLGETPKAISNITESIYKPPKHYL